MITTNEKRNCSGCSACAAVCPKACISMETDNEGFKYPKIDLEFCVNCGLCDNSCPVLHPIPKNNHTPAAFCAINLDDEIRMSSSSSGVFYLLSEYVISNNGVVFGAKFDEDFKVVHDCAQTLEEVKAFMSSKYTQSDIGQTYLCAKEFLTAGRLVLFTGTPCQISGLKKFLNNDYENLICQDLICHGVPSPMAWRKYIDFREAQSRSKTSEMSFRRKKQGWKTYSVWFKFSNGDEFEEMHKTDVYMRSFLRNLSLRPSCYHCAFKSKSRDSDITLADFWGVQNVLPHMDDDKGTSLVIIHSSKGNRVFDAIKENLKCEQVDFDLAIKYNSCMIKAVPENPQRKKFLSEIQKRPFDKVVYKYCQNKVTVIVRIKMKIKALLKKVMH